MDNIWQKMEFKFRICILVFLSGVLATPIGILLYSFDEILSFYFGFLGLAATIIGIIAMLVYWANWADS